MDLLTHIFLPLAMIYSAGTKNRRILLISPLAILPDLDVFLGIHRGLFHSLFIIIPIIALAFFLSKEYFKYVAFFLSSHLFLDFITGGVPFLYPMINTGIGIKFPLIVKFESFPTIVEYLPKIVFSIPSLVHGKSYDIISSFGIASLLLFISIYYIRNR